MKDQLHAHDAPPQRRFSGLSLRPWFVAAGLASVVVMGSTLLSNLDGDPQAQDSLGPRLTAPSTSPVAANPCNGSSGGVIGDRIVRFKSLREMAAASEAVVVVRATEDVTIEELGEELPTPFTVTRLEVLRTLQGTVRSPLRLRQLGTATQCLDPDSTVVQPGKTYIVAVTQNTDDPGAPGAGQYAVSGAPAGLFEFDASRGRAKRLDPGSPSLPGELSVAEFAAAIVR